MNLNTPISLTRLLKTGREHPSIVEVLNSLGVSIIDNNASRFISKGVFSEFDGIDNPDENEWISRIHPNDLEQFKKDQEALRRGQNLACKNKIRIRDDQGNWKVLSSKSGVLLRNEDGTPQITISIGSDLTSLRDEQKSVEQKAQDADILISTIEVIISSLNLDDTVQRILDQAKRLFPYDQATIQVLHESSLEILGGEGFPDDVPCKNIKYPFPDELSLSTRAIQERHPWKSNDVAHDSLEYNQLADGMHTIRSWLGIPLIAHGDVIGLLTFANFEADSFHQRHLDLAKTIAGPVAIAFENARMHGETYQLAMHDALTGIGNRHAFNLNGKYFFEKARRDGRELSFAMLDLDHFKKINDDFGHLVGDRVLQAVCQSCERTLRTTDFIARYGGEEIIILFPDASTDTAARIVVRICRDVANLKIEGVSRPVTVSAGIAGLQANSKKSMDDVINEADEALYQSKSNGRNRITVYQRNSSSR